MTKTGTITLGKNPNRLQMIRIALESPSNRLRIALANTCVRTRLVLRGGTEVCPWGLNLRSLEVGALGILTSPLELYTARFLMGMEYVDSGALQAAGLRILSPSHHSPVVG